jgi:hypothetical protein
MFMFRCFNLCIQTENPLTRINIMNAKKLVVTWVVTTLSPIVCWVTANTQIDLLLNANVGSTGLPYTIIDTMQENLFDAQGKIMDGAVPGDTYYGQDAQHLGVVPDYIVSEDGLTVTDATTGLMWQQRGSTLKLTYWEALEYVNVINAEGFAGYSDWRLPSIKELYSLMDFRGTDPSTDDTSNLIPFIDSSVFWFSWGDPEVGDRIIDSQWVSSTVYVADTSTVFGVNFADGRIKGYGMNGMNGTGKTFEVRLVRGNQAYGINQFVDNEDDTISDLATGLMWMKNDSQIPLDWAGALAWADQVNALNYMGYSDWRVPNAKELQSILDYSRSPDTTGSAAIDPVFNTTAIENLAGDTDFAFYWSSTTHKRYGSTGVAGADASQTGGQGFGPPPQQGQQTPVLDADNSANPTQGDGQIIGSAAAYVCFGRGLGEMRNTLIDIHGAGCQRSDPKSGNAEDYPQSGNGPQGDVRRVYNMVRLVRDI